MNGDDLFSLADEEQSHSYKPLAVRMRPTSLDDIYGQDAVLGPGSFLRRMIEKDAVPSLLLYGPSGVGKTTIANVIAAETKSHFVTVNAVTAGAAELKKVIQDAKDALHLYQKRTILFIDEIHRFNKSQQDILLPYVEDGTVILVGATTENPYFEVNRPLLSRLRVVQLQPLTIGAVVQMLRRAMNDTAQGLGRLHITASDDVLQAMAHFADGDGRVALNLLEQAAMCTDTSGVITEQVLEQAAGKRLYRYDKKGDNHYDITSAFIKSMRGSDPDAALHYAARMIAGGEDPSYISRRLVICAAEDVGLADPQALVIANAAAQAVQLIGWPEGRIILAEAIVYVACAPKSNSAYKAMDAALADVRHGDCGTVPAHLQDSHYSGAASLGHGKGYVYPQDYPDGYVAQQYLPDALQGRTYYEPKERGKEREMAAQWKQRRGQV